MDKNLELIKSEINNLNVLSKTNNIDEIIKRSSILIKKYPKIQIFYNYLGSSLEKINQVVNVRDGEILFGLNMVVHKGKTIFVGDTSVHEYPTSEQMAEIAISTARVVRLFGFEPKVAFLSH